MTETLINDIATGIALLTSVAGVLYQIYRDKDYYKPKANFRGRLSIFKSYLEKSQFEYQYDIINTGKTNLNIERIEWYRAEKHDRKRLSVKMEEILIEPGRKKKIVFTNSSYSIRTQLKIFENKGDILKSKKFHHNTEIKLLKSTMGLFKKDSEEAAK